ncbi:MAG: CDP-diacylglycerol--glycerol-3-phosphate 3-phosphatidyltransferase [Hellea sp.]|jgi:CDP-diacylglycerol--glycerol-3-phosphate 3-phosphatidyltransferase|nr:CDP-diacylglycerol--glycerol-3-phosphate 3-phosphatidyltransferase [Hellea sp.]MDG1141601.1 CDP-diacylglycerol--glycerol-3-phosphate 3-phosphatidyltransferase [Hellea sp.]
MIFKSDKRNNYIFSRIPNILTISRILLIPIIIMSLIGFRFGFDDLSNKTIIYSCLAYAFISDFLDGYIARKWKLESGFGRMIDPIADKLLVAGCLISYCIIAQGNMIILIPAIVIIFRDILVSGIREYASNSGVLLPPTKLAKWKTAFEFLAIILLASFFANHNFEGPLKGSTSLNGVAGILSLWFSSVLSLWTAAIYFKHGLKN